MKKVYISIILFFCAYGLSHAQFIEAQQCIGGSGRDSIVAVTTLADGSTIIAVQTTSSDGDFQRTYGGQDVALIKLNLNKQIEWIKTIGDSLSDEWYIGTEFIRDRYYVTTVHYDSTAQCICRKQLTVLDLNGNFKWKTDAGTPVNEAVTIKPAIDTATNQIYVVDEIVSADVQLSKFDYNGNMIYQKYLNIGVGSCFGYMCACYNIPSILDITNEELILYSHMFVCTGFFVGYTANIIVKIDSSGDIISPITALPSNLFPTKIKNISDTIEILSDSSGIVKINRNDLGYTLSTNGPMLSISNGRNLGNLFTNGYSVGFPDSVLMINNLQTGTSVSDKLDSVLLFYPYYYPDVAYNELDSSIYITYADSKSYPMLHFRKYRLNGNLEFEKILFASSDTFQLASGPLTYFSDTNVIVQFSVADVNNSYNYQAFQIISLKEGNLLFEYKNFMPDYLVYKYAHLLSNNRLFTVGDLDGIHTCQLGDFDVQLAILNNNTNYVYGKAFIDYNNNKVQEGSEPSYKSAYLATVGSSRTITTKLRFPYTVHYIDTTTWITKLTPFYNYFTITPDSFISYHTSFDNSDTVVFALYPKTAINDLSVSLVNSFVTRLGRSANYVITYTNNGSTVMDGTVMYVPDHRLYFESSVPTATTSTGDTLYWNFTGLAPGESRSIYITDTAGIPTVLNAGDTIISYAMITPVAGDTTPPDNSAILKEGIRAAYDPNDKSTTAGENITEQQVASGEYLTYVVRFQNVGNDTAFRVVIEDTIDNNLDISTLQPLDASHAFTMHITGNIIQYIFDLTLPDSSADENASHGYVSYRIKPKASLTLGATIKNTAHIYFDFNAPVKTSTVNTRVGLISGLVQQQNTGKVKLYPNPNTGMFMLEYNCDNTAEITLQLIDMKGSVVYKNNYRNNRRNTIPLSLDNLSKGIYTLVLHTSRETLTQKVVVQ